jgi:hypothetical protein
MSTLSFEPERHFVEDAVAASGQTVVSCFLVPEKARDTASNIAKKLATCVKLLLHVCRISLRTA